MDEDEDYEQYAHYADDHDDHEQEHDEKALIHVQEEGEGEGGEGDGDGEQAVVPYDHGIVPDIQNIVATVNLGTPLDLKQIAMRARNAEYNPKKFSACTMRIRSPKTTALVFSSGKLVVTGARQVDQAKLAARKYARIIQRIGFSEVRFLDFTIRNMVAKADVRFPIKLEELAQMADETSSYEPEIFPGLVYHMTQPKIVVLVFVSGKVVITGAKSHQDIIDGFDAIFPILQDYQKSNPIT